MLACSVICFNTPPAAAMVTVGNVGPEPAGWTWCRKGEMPQGTASRIAVGLAGLLLAASGLAGCGATGFQASGVDFPTEGCWEITGALPSSSLRFVTFVVKKGA
jgi:hypothetical protein